MITSKKVNGTAVSMPLGLTIGILVSVASTVIWAAVLTSIVLSGKIPEKLIGYFAMGITSLSSMLGSLIAAIRIKRRWMLVSCIAGVSYYLILLSVTAIFFGGNYHGFGVTAAMVVIGCCISGLLGLLKGKRGNKHFKKYRTC